MVKKKLFLKKISFLSKKMGKFAIKTYYNIEINFIYYG